MYCIHCGQEISGEGVGFCSKCGKPINNAANTFSDDKKNLVDEKKEGKLATMTSKINALAGGEGAVSLHLKDLVANVFKHHSPEETEELFICGTKQTTPAEKDIIAEWPKPWLYSRVGLVLIIAYLIMVFIYNQFSNNNVLPDILFIGSLAMPITILVLFFEMNVPRNISFFDTIKTFIIGGAASLVVTLFGFKIITYDGNSYVSAILTGIIEEAGKAAIVAYLVSKMKGRKWLLNGILYGGAVGAGFAVFESAGYALRYGIQNGLNYYEYCMSNSLSDYAFGYFYSGFYKEMMDIVKTRAFLSPGGHVAWAAVTGFAIILSLDGRDFGWDVFVNSKFLKIFLIPIALHAVWDMPINLPFYLKYIVLTALIWIVLLVFTNRGFEQITEVVSEMQNAQEGGERNVLP